MLKLVKDCIVYILYDMSLYLLWDLDITMHQT